MVLVRPRGGLNVGSVARLIKNLAAGPLVVVAGEYDLGQASLLAVHGTDVFEGRREVATLEEAVAGGGLVVGTTARPGAYRQRTRDVREIAEDVARACIEAGASGRAPVVVFGPEDTGLSNREIAYCHELAYVPTGPEYASLNLSHAVAVVLYEILRARMGILDSPAQRRAPRPPADAAELEAALVDFERALSAIGFLKPDTSAHIMQSVRAMFGRARMDERDVRILRGIASQIDWFAAEGHRVLARKAGDPDEA